MSDVPRCPKTECGRAADAQVPNSNYCAFEDWVMPVLSAMLREQREQGACWTPSKVRLAQTAQARVQGRRMAWNCLIFCACEE